MKSFRIENRRSICKTKVDDFYGEYYPSNSLYRQGQSRHGVALRQVNIEQNDLYEATLRYGRNFDKLTVNLLGGYSYQEFNTSGELVNAGGFLTDLFTYNNVNTASEVNKGLAEQVHIKMDISLKPFLQEQISILMTHGSFSLSVRNEGSDRFGEGIKEEPFRSQCGG
jgi:iron complex outermembrane receptor protein